ncbi:hypothetical protein [Methylobacterium dankookense]|uniref:Formate dehydrogenase-O major subunit n=1 Tax=Methylobacterium dankookense TaxID=560405 RepID=A0A564G5N1_9HYPH|nr:hypothetical protein IFDJLNFL_1663 [Methylobacterium dankookense]VUF15853.1 Formate dehydrogenase-O major subunit [Methylobacterium dankookense]
MAAAVRPFKLAQMRETRNTCPYCSVACGVILYSLGDRSKNARSAVMHGGDGSAQDRDRSVHRGVTAAGGSAAARAPYLGSAREPPDGSHGRMPSRPDDLDAPGRPVPARPRPEAGR